MNIDISGKEEQLERCVSGQKTRRTEWGHSVRWKRKLWKRGHASSARATEKPGEVRHVGSDCQSLVSGDLFEAEG